MSLLTARPLTIAPPAAAGLTVTSGAAAGAYGNWVAFATVASLAYVAGISIYSGTWASASIDVDIGIGIAGLETSLGSPIRFQGNNSGGGGISNFMPLAPIAGIPAGAIVSLRTRDSTSGSQVYTIKLIYYLGLDSDHLEANPFIAVPNPSTTVAMTPSGTAWTNPANWTQLSAGQTNDTYVMGLGFYPGVGGVDVEFDIGTGAAAAEVNKTTLRAGFGGQNTRLSYALLPALLKLPASTRIAGRLRHSSTSVTAYRVALLGYDTPAAVTPPTPATDYPCNIKTPVFVGALSVAGSNFVFSKQPLRDPATYPTASIGGFKAPRLANISPITWAVSDWLTGAWPSQTMTMKIIDFDRFYRNLSRPSLIGGRAWAYLFSEATRLAQGNWTLLFQGPIFDDPFAENLTYDVQANDAVSVDYNLFKADKMIPQRTIGADFPNRPTTSDGLGVPIVGGAVTTTNGAIKLIDVGNLTVGGTTYAVGLLCGHACAGGVQAAYQNGSLVASWGTNFWAPGQTGWSTVQPSGALYFDINGNRYTLVFLTGTPATNFQNGTWPVYVNANGFEPNADGSGSYVAGLLDQERYLMEQFITQNYLGGAWLTPATFTFYPGGAATTPVVDATSYSTAQTLSGTYLGGGFLGGFVIGANGVRQSVRDVIKKMNVSAGNLFMYLNDQSQLAVKMFDTTRSTFLGSTRAITDRRDILDNPRFRMLNHKTDWFSNDLGYQWAENYRGDSSGQWGSRDSQGHAPSQITFNKVTRSETYALIRDAATAGAVGGQRRTFGGVSPPRPCTWPASLCGMNNPVASGIPITHYNGSGPNGWVNNAVLILSRTLDPSTCKVTFIGMDVQNRVS